MRPLEHNATLRFARHFIICIFFTRLSLKQRQFTSALLRYNFLVMLSVQRINIKILRVKGSIWTLESWKFVSEKGYEPCCNILSAKGAYYTIRCRPVQPYNERKYANTDSFLISFLFSHFSYLFLTNFFLLLNNPLGRSIWNSNVRLVIQSSSKLALSIDLFSGFLSKRETACSLAGRWRKRRPALFASTVRKLNAHRLELSLRYS